MTVITIGVRYGKPFIAFDQCDVPPTFFETARQLGYKIRVTGGNVETHEIGCSLEDFNILVDLASQAAGA